MHREAHRLDALDALRGIAVILMIAWHTASSWLALEHRDGLGWTLARVIGGLGAPLFLFVAGAAVALGAQRGRPIADVVRRGAEVVVIGFALRLFLWTIDARAALTLEAWPVIVLGALSCGVAIYGLRARSSVLVLAAILALGYVACAVVFAAPAMRRIFDFDVLHAIGVSTILVALVLRWKRAHWGILALVAVVLALLTKLAGDAMATPWLAWIARPNELASFAAFPILPWCAYAFLGAAAALAPRPQRRLFLFALALVIAFATYEAGYLWSTSMLGPYPWLRPLGRLVFYAACAVALTVTVASLRPAARALVPLGKLSLVIYCVHLELVFGLAARPLVRRLDPTEWAALALVFVIGTAIAAHVLVRARTPSREGRPQQASAR